MPLTRKHVVEGVGLAVDLTTTPVNAIIALGALNPDYFTNRNNVKAESRIFSLIFQLEIHTESYSAADISFFYDWYIGFNINNAQTLPGGDTVGLSHLKNQIFHQDGCMQSGIKNTINSSPYQTSVWRGVLKIPIQWQTLNDGDALILHIKSNNAQLLSGYKYRFIYMEHQA